RFDLHATRPASGMYRQIEAFCKQVTRSRKGVAAKRARVALDAALARRHVGHAARRHVTLLAVDAARRCRALAPLGVGRIDTHAEHSTLVTGTAITAVLVDRKRAERLARAHGVLERTVEELLRFFRAQQIERVDAEGFAQPGTHTGHLV